MLMAAALALSPPSQMTMQAADGDLDGTFGNGGTVVTDFGGTDQGFGMAIQADGRIVVVGATFQQGLPGGFAIARYLASGVPDSSFDQDGKVTVRIPPASVFATAVAIQADGRIVVAGVAGPGERFALVRLNPDGSLDPSFDGDGIVVTAAGPQITERAEAVAIQSDGKIVAAGATFDFSTFTRTFALTRYNADGSLDPSFGGDGKVTTAFAAMASAQALVIQPDGKIIAAGLEEGVTVRSFALARYEADGTLDASFGAGGQVTTAIGALDSRRSLALQPDGKILLAGSTSALGARDFGIVRYAPDGSLDLSFGIGGIVITDVGQDDGATSIAVQADGRIVAAGFTANAASTVADFALARYTADGALDPAFGTAGIATTDVSVIDIVFGIGIQIDGKIVAAGSAIDAPGSTSNFALARYDVAPPHDVTFFLHGADIPGTAGGFTMNESAPGGLLVSVGTRTWFSEPAVVGTFVSGATFQVTMPCVLGVSLPKSVRLAATDLTGGSEQVLGEAARGLSLCGQQTIAIPVTTPLTLANKRLKLTIRSSPLLPVIVPLGRSTFLRATSFAGTP